MKLAVIGAGDMGHGIAQLAATAGHDVALSDIDAAVLDRAVQRIGWSLDKLVEKHRLDADAAKQALDRIHPTTAMADALDGAQLVIEAVPEELALKRDVLAKAQELAPSAVIASNTSALSITEIGADLPDPSRSIGLHFFNPVLLMDLVEIVPGEETSSETLAAGQAFCDQLGKTHITLLRDAPGFVTTRLIVTWMNAAALAAEFIGAEPRLIDAAMRGQAGFPMGPFELADFTGLDIGHHAATYMAERLHEGLRPPESVTERVGRGEFGKKTGQGFYAWDGGRLVEGLEDVPTDQFDPRFILSITTNEAVRVLDEGIATASQIDEAMQRGCAFPVGPLAWGDEHGPSAVLEALDTVHGSTKHPLFEPAEGLRRRAEAGEPLAPDRSG